jgi:hypothetical protein
MLHIRDADGLDSINASPQDFHRLLRPGPAHSRPIDTQAIKYKALKQILVRPSQLKGITQGLQFGYCQRGFAGFLLN